MPVPLIIKICGVRDPQFAKTAVLAGASYIGIIFHPTSRRYVDIETAVVIAKQVRESAAQPVAVFVNQTVQEMLTICEFTGIQVIQLHGARVRQQHHLLPSHLQRIYVQTVSDAGVDDIDGGLKYCQLTRDFLLFDNVNPGEGISFNWDKFKYTGKFRWFLAGGLNPNNAQQGIHKMQPYGVDVSSGVENNLGIKDVNLLQRFMHSCGG